MAQDATGQVQLSDVAAAAGVSKATASRALNDSGYVSPEARDRVRETARRLGYRPNRVARALRSARSGVIGLLLPDLRNEYYAVSSEAIHRELQKVGVRLMVASAHTPAEERGALEDFVAQRVDGIIHVPVAREHTVPRGVPVVQLNRWTGDGSVPAVVSDETTGIRELTEVLLRGGRSRAAIVIGAEGLSTTEARTRGFLQATGDAGVAARVFAGEYTAEWGRAGTRAALDWGATAILAASPRLAVGAVSTLRERGVEVPRECALASYADPEWFTLVNPAMTTFAPPLEEMGRRAATTLLEMLDNPSAPAAGLVTLPGTVIERSSTLPAD